MSKIFQLEGGQYEHPNEYKLVSTVRGTTILQPEFGTVIIEGDVIEASTHNTIQKNGVLASKVNVTMESTDTVLVPTDMTIESDLFNELKIMLLFETGTTLPSNSFIKLKETNVPIANVNDYVVDANTPLLFLYFDSKFYAYKAGSGTSTGASKLDDLSDVVVTTPTSGQALVYNGTNFVNQTISSGTNQWKVIFDGAFGVQGGVVASLPNDWSDCLIYYSVYPAAPMNNSSMLITSSEKGGKSWVHYVGYGEYAIKINVNAINQVVLTDRYGEAVINKVLYKNNI